MKTVELPMNIPEIQKSIPHRFPFLLVDRVIEMETTGDRKYIKAIKCISMTDPILQGHFPNFPVVPGVIIVEGLAQAAGVLGDHLLKDGLSTCLLTEITKARFKRQVVPGDVITYEVTSSKSKGPFHWFEAIASVDGEVAAEVSLSALMK